MWEYEKSIKVLFLLLLKCSFCQIVITGTVLEEGSNNPIIGGVVEIESLHLQQKTNTEGKFTIPLTSVGTFTLRVSADIFEQKKMLISAKEESVK